jgi:hypothetical protein
MFEQLETQEFEENPVLKLEQKLESRKINHVVVMWSPSLSLLGRTRSCSVRSSVTGSASISQIQFDY